MEGFTPPPNEGRHVEEHEIKRFKRPALGALFVAAGIVLTPQDASAQERTTDPALEDHLEELRTQREFSFHTVAPLFEKYGLAHVDTEEEWEAAEHGGVVAFVELAGALNESAKSLLESVAASEQMNQKLLEQYGPDVAETHKDATREAAEDGLRKIFDDLTTLEMAVANTRYEEKVDSLIGDEGILMQDFGPMTSALRQLQDYAREQGWSDETEL